ncbi:hypothetical protein Scep_000543 [Stephania cephalantha]|uniref:Uncharacterized protein n=1 Tax=Stephania cephalantha TaxID=152367 RepID=A0AAP0Q2J5_9MAGN
MMLSLRSLRDFSAALSAISESPSLLLPFSASASPLLPTFSVLLLLLSASALALSVL